MDSSTNTVRDALGSPVLSYVANRGALLVAVVSALTLLVRPLAAVVGGGLLALYLLGGYDALYHGLRRRAALGPLADLAARTVLLLGGVCAIPVVLTWVGLGTTLTRSLAGILQVPLGLLMLLGGTLVVLEGLGLLRGRIALALAEPYVGQSVDDGLVAVQGEAEPAAAEDDEPRVMTDGGRQISPEQRADPFDGTAFEAADGDPETDTEPATYDRGPQFASSLFAAVRDGHDAPAGYERDREDRFGIATSPPDTAEVTVDASMVLDRTGDLDHDTEGDDRVAYTDPASVDGDPVAVDAETGRVVATRGECTPDAWRAAVVDWLVESFERRHGVDLSEDRAARNRLQSVAGRTREDLARRTRTEILLPFVAEVDGATVHLRRSLAAVGPDGSPRSTPPFGDENPVDFSRDLVHRSRSVSGTADIEVPAVTARTGPDTGDTGPDRPTRDSTVPDTPTTGASEPDTADDTSEAEATHEVESLSRSDTTGPVQAPHSDTPSAHYRRQRREKFARPRPLARLPAEPGRRLDAALPETVPLGEALPATVTDRLPLPDRLSVPGVPDVYEDDPDRPGVRYLADDDASSDAFRVEGFGEVTVDPAGLRPLFGPTESGSDGPGLWYETRVESGDDVAVLGRAVTRDGETTLEDAGAGRFVAGRDDVETLGSTMTRGALARLGVGLPVAGGGFLLATAGLPGGAGTLLAGSAVAGGAVAVNQRDRLTAAVVAHGRSVAAFGRRLAGRLGPEDDDTARRSTEDSSLPARIAERVRDVREQVRERRQ